MDYKLKRSKQRLQELKEEINKKKITQGYLAKKLDVSQWLNADDCFLSTFENIKEIIKEL